MTLGFIIIRHVNSANTNEYWIESLRCVKKYYPNHPIMIIDDNSNQEFLSTDIDLTDVTIVQSEFHKRGELLPYYYFYKLKPFDKAVIIHDSVFVQKYVNFDHVNDISFLWSFSSHKWVHCPDSELKIISSLKNNDTLIRLYDCKNIWLGCFGVMSCITHDFLSIMVENYDMFRLLDHIDSRFKRCCLERVFAVMCYSLVDVNSIFGDLHTYINFQHYDFQQYKNNELNDFPFVKVWTGR
jgi:hypothetical protein